MLGLITDRTWSNVMRLEELSSTRWGDMTASEQAEWMGDPFTAVGYGAVNLIPNGPHVSHGADLVYRNQYLRATANSADVGLYATVVIGDAQHFEDKSITLSVDEIQSDGGAPRVALYWHDENGDDYAGVALSKAGSVTATLSKNVSMRPQLAMCIWATTTTKMNIGDSTTYTGLMLELGTERHTYVPYTEIVATPATKGAYNHSDLNRVERAVEEISELCGLDLITKTDWRPWDVPTEGEITRYLNNINAIRNAYVGPVILPVVPSNGDQLNYQTANDIERILEIVHTAKSSASLGSMILGMATLGG